MVHRRQAPVTYRGSQTRSHSTGFVIGVVCVVCVLICAATFGLLRACSIDPTLGSSSSGPLSLGANDRAHTMQTSSKLEGATETVDEFGIVHGVLPDGTRYTVHGRGQAAQQEDKVTFVAAGDIIGTDNSLPIADRYAGSSGDGSYSFAPFFKDVTPFIQSFDLRYVNQETVMAGNENGYAYSGYPMFNTPDAAAEAIAGVGFNLVNFTTNHTYDMGTYGIERSHEVWARYPELIIGGSYLSQEDRDTVQLIERNGMTFAFLAYTYGDNMYLDASAMPNDYYSSVFDKEVAAADIERAKKIADAVIVSMHWGSEYSVEPNEQQWDWARFLADQDVDLVIGTHAHIMQPTKYVTGESGTTIPVVFGLSDFVSGWTLTDCILSGLFTCDFARDADGSISVENPMWHPTIEWSDGGDVYVRRLSDMDDATIDANTRTEDVYNDSTYLREFIAAAGMEIPVAWQ